MDVAEAFRPVYILRRAFWVLIALLGLCAVVIFVAMLYMARQQAPCNRPRLRLNNWANTHWNKNLARAAWGRSTKLGTPCCAGRPR